MKGHSTNILELSAAFDTIDYSVILDIPLIDMTSRDRT